MSEPIFSEGGAFFQSDIKAGSAALSARAVLKLGGETADMCLVGVSRGDQPARIQIDATVSGDLYAIGCAGGVGQYHMVFYDGLRNSNCAKAGGGGGSNSSIMRRYLQLRNLKSRKAAVYIYPPTSSNASSSCCGVFRGLVKNMSADLKEEEGGNVALYVGITVIGSWTRQ